MASIKNTITHVLNNDKEIFDLLKQILDVIDISTKNTETIYKDLGLVIEETKTTSTISRIIKYKKNRRKDKQDLKGFRDLYWIPPKMIDPVIDMFTNTTTLQKYKNFLSTLEIWGANNKVGKAGIKIDLIYKDLFLFLLFPLLMNSSSKEYLEDYVSEEYTKLKQDKRIINYPEIIKLILDRKWGGSILNKDNEYRIHSILDFSDLNIRLIERMLAGLRVNYDVVVDINPIDGNIFIPFENIPKIVLGTLGKIDTIGQLASFLFLGGFLINDFYRIIHDASYSKNKDTKPYIGKLLTMQSFLNHDNTITINTNSKTIWSENVPNNIFGNIININTIHLFSDGSEWNVFDLNFSFKHRTNTTRKPSAGTILFDCLKMLTIMPQIQSSITGFKFSSWVKKWDNNDWIDVNINSLDISPKKGYSYIITNKKENYIDSSLTDVDIDIDINIGGDEYRGKYWESNYFADAVPPEPFKIIEWSRWDSDNRKIWTKHKTKVDKNYGKYEPKEIQVAIMRTETRTKTWKNMNSEEKKLWNDQNGYSFDPSEIRNGAVSVGLIEDSKWDYNTKLWSNMTNDEKYEWRKKNPTKLDPADSASIIVPRKTTNEYVWSAMTYEQKEEWKNQNRYPRTPYTNSVLQFKEIVDSGSKEWKSWDAASNEEKQKWNNSNYDNFESMILDKTPVNIPVDKLRWFIEQSKIKQIQSKKYNSIEKKSVLINLDGAYLQNRFFRKQVETPAIFVSKFYNNLTIGDDFETKQHIEIRDWRFIYELVHLYFNTDNIYNIPSLNQTLWKSSLKNNLLGLAKEIYMNKMYILDFTHTTVHYTFIKEEKGVSEYTIQPIFGNFTKFIKDIFYSNNIYNDAGELLTNIIFNPKSVYNKSFEEIKIKYDIFQDIKGKENYPRDQQKYFVPRKDEEITVNVENMYPDIMEWIKIQNWLGGGQYGESVVRNLNLPIPKNFIKNPNKIGKQNKFNHLSNMADYFIVHGNPFLFTDVDNNFIKTFNNSSKIFISYYRIVFNYIFKNLDSILKNDLSKPLFILDHALMEKQMMKIYQKKNSFSTIADQKWVKSFVLNDDDAVKIYNKLYSFDKDYFYLFLEEKLTLLWKDINTEQYLGDDKLSYQDLYKNIFELIIDENKINIKQTKNNLEFFTTKPFWNKHSGLQYTNTGCYTIGFNLDSTSSSSNTLIYKQNQRKYFTFKRDKFIEYDKSNMPNDKKLSQEIFQDFELDTNEVITYWKNMQDLYTWESVKTFKKNILKIIYPNMDKKKLSKEERWKSPVIDKYIVSEQLGIKTVYQMPLNEFDTTMFYLASILKMIPDIEEFINRGNKGDFKRINTPNDFWKHLTLFLPQALMPIVEILNPENISYNPALNVISINLYMLGDLIDIIDSENSGLKERVAEHAVYLFIFTLFLHDYIFILFNRQKLITVLGGKTASNTSFRDTWKENSNILGISKGEPEPGKTNTWHEFNRKYWYEYGNLEYKTVSHQELDIKKELLKDILDDKGKTKSKEIIDYKKSGSSLYPNFYMINTLLYRYEHNKYGPIYFIHDPTAREINLQIIIPWVKFLKKASSRISKRENNTVSQENNIVSRESKNTYRNIKINDIPIYQNNKIEALKKSIKEMSDKIKTQKKTWEKYKTDSKDDILNMDINNKIKNIKKDIGNLANDIGNLANDVDANSEALKVSKKIETLLALTGFKKD